MRPDRSKQDLVHVFWEDTNKFPRRHKLRFWNGLGWEDNCVVKMCPPRTTHGSIFCLIKSECLLDDTFLWESCQEGEEPGSMSSKQIPIEMGQLIKVI